MKSVYKILSVQEVVGRPGPEIRTIRFGLSIVVFLCLAATTLASATSDSAQVKISRLHTRIQAIATGEVKPDPADTTVEGGAWIVDFLSSSVSNWGAVVAIEAPAYLSDREASIVIRLEDNAYELIVAVEENGEWGTIKLTNYVAPEDRTTLETSDLGNDTLRVAPIDDLESFVETFNSDSGAVRVISILSPT